MAIHIATKTLFAINKQIEQDQGAAFRQFEKAVFPHMSDAYRGAENNPHRQHLGASGIGKDCARAIWYSFRWFTKPHFDGRILRLFNRGHLEEARFIAMLLAIGVEVFQQDANGKQYRISDMGGHFGGSGDGVGIKVPDIPDGMPSLLEFKTHNDKSFTKLAGKSYSKFVEGVLDPKAPQVAFDGEGVASAKYEHYVQMQVYMRKMNLNVGLYGAVNKNDDHIYLELVMPDPLLADQFIDRAKQIIRVHAEPPKKINNSPGWFECKYCDHRPVCHLGAVPERNCRTCHFIRARENGTWECIEPKMPKDSLTEEQQMAGCSEYTRLC